MSTLLFVIEAREGKGMGHVYRSISIIEKLKKHSDIHAIFLCHKGRTIIKEMVGLNATLNFKHNKDEALSLIKSIKPDMVINDCLDNEAFYISELKKISLKVINIEDIGEGSFLADKVINCVYSDCGQHNALYGEKYMDIRDAFHRNKPFVQRDSEFVKNVLVNFGGEDPNNITMKVLRVIANSDYLKTFHYTLALGSRYRSLNEVEAFTKINRLKVDIKLNTDLATLMPHADIAVLANCRTVFEAAFMLLPSVIISANARECLHTFYRKVDFPYCGNGLLINDDIIEHKISQLILDKEYRAHIIKNLEQLEIGQGLAHLESEIMTIPR